MSRAQVRRAMMVVNGNDTRHDLLSAAQVFQQLGIEAGFATRKALGTSRFAEPLPETAESDVYLLYTAGGQFTTAQQSALAAAVAAGKGLVAVHATNVLGVVGAKLDPAYRPLFELLGSRRLGHGPGAAEGRQSIAVVADHPVTRGVGDFELFDGHAELEFADGAVTVLAERRREAGDGVPVLYVRTVGEGRVVYLALGHDMRAWGEPPVRALVRQALLWAAQCDEATHGDNTRRETRTRRDTDPRRDNNPHRDTDTRRDSDAG